MQPTIPDLATPVQRRPLDLEDYLNIVRRHLSWILAPAFLGLVAGFVIAYSWPDTFTAVGTLRILPPQVPYRLVAPNVSEEMAQRVQAIFQGIVSRDSLANVITTYNLYPDKRKKMPLDDVVDQMHEKDVAMSKVSCSAGAGVGRSATCFFTVSFSYGDRRLAAKVDADLISRFMEESIRSRAMQSENTTVFFQEEVAQAKEQLDAIDQKIAAFKTSNEGALPDEANTLMMGVQAVEANIQSLNLEQSRASQEKIQLEAQLRFLKEQIPAAPQPVVQGDNSQAAAAPMGVPADDHLNDLNKDVDQLESRVALLKETDKETHPDVVRATALLNSLKRQRDDYAAKLASQKPADRPRSLAGAPVPVNVQYRQQLADINRLQAQIQAKDMEIEDLNRQVETARVRSKDLQAKVEASPLARSGYMALMRDRETAAQKYGDVSRRLQDSSMASDLEGKKAAERLEELEKPIIPNEPSAPKRPIIIGLAAAAGCMLGLVLAIAREVKDISLKSLKDVRAYTQLTLLGSIPLLENDFIVRRRRRFLWLGWSAGLIIGILVISGSVVYYMANKT